MMELELKHLAPYLAYGLKVRSSEGMTEILGYEWVNGKIIYQFDTDDDSGDFAFDDPIKPILRPLSDLTEVFEDDSFENEFRNIVGGEWCDIYDDAIIHILDNLTNLDSIHINALPYDLIKYMLSKHYDIFGLIENNLAIDINTLNDGN